MWELKYYKAIRRAQKHPGSQMPDVFDLGRARDKSIVTRLISCPALWWVLRQLCPIRIHRLVLVTRAEDVAEVLLHPETFEVPFGLEMEELIKDANFVLGMEGQSHDEMKEITENVFKKTDLPLLKGESQRIAKALINASAGRIDVVHDLFMRVATETCLAYFGIEASDHDVFADWTHALSHLLFADPFGDPQTRQLALYAAARLRAVADRAIAKAKLRLNSKIASETLVDRLVGLQSSHPELTDAKIRGALIGLSVGFIPTVTTAAGNVLESLLDRDARWDAATKCAKHSDEEALRAIVHEALRLNATVPFQFRYATKKTVIAKGTLRERIVPANSVVAAVTMSALRDGRAFPSPNRFDATRKQEYVDPKTKKTLDPMFGVGPHWCLGKQLALTLLTETFLVLLSQKNIRRAGLDEEIKWVGPFPRHFNMTFDPPGGPADQSMITICAPVLQGINLEELRADVAALGNPAGSSDPKGAALAKALEATNIVHFASLTLAECGNEPGDKPYLVLELNLDGPEDTALSTFASATQKWLQPIFYRTEHTDFESLASILKRDSLSLHRWPWGAIGLDFSGTGEFSVRDIDKQQRLATFAKDALDSYLQHHANLNSPYLALDYVRKLIRPDARIRAMASKQNPQSKALDDLLKRGAEFADDVIRPSGQKLRVSTWTPRTGFEAFLKAVPAAVEGMRIAAAAGVGLMAAAIYLAFGSNLFNHIAGRVLLVIAGTVGCLIVLVGVVVMLFAWLLRQQELRDVPVDKSPLIQGDNGMKAAAFSEDREGYAQNHFAAVTMLKEGWLRKFTLALALWGVRLRLRFWDRPGFVTSIGTIHYAKWFRVPNTGALVFLANYDGSWESYLEDFITLAHPGQTAVWSNGYGFPRTQILLWGGAEDGDRFKRWVRRQQVVSQFWYSRYPRLTTNQIRNNALILDGLAKATTNTAARAWLGCFGSIQRPESAIETDEVQSLVFRSMGRLKYSVCALIQFSDAQDGPRRRQKWLRSLHSSSGDHPEDRDLLVTFGDYPVACEQTDVQRGNPVRPATFVAFSAHGLRKLGVPDGDADAGLDTFPAPFNLGMAHRSRVLGDYGDAAPQHWRWWDAKPDSTETTRAPADALLFIFADTEERCRQALEAHLDKSGSKRLHCVPTAPTDKGIDYEHFGFRDGVSQPVIRGTQRFTKNPLARDIVEPGEFILGYPSNQSSEAQSYFPPSPMVRAETDVLDQLPVAAAQSPPSLPEFDRRKDYSDLRDFGRNGTFIVVRQLEQDVKGFHNFAETQARELTKCYSSIATMLDQNITHDWIEAKMLGRWHDGTPLIDRPHPQSSMRGQQAPEVDNDFAYGVDDPQGLACPLGSHIRRANPRDSLSPGSQTQQAITNRHRILRRGRAYKYDPAEVSHDPADGANSEMGLLFVCLCADLGRQYEFVQQTWVGSPFFHGLVDEPDPIVGTDTLNIPEPGERVFTIPTPSGPLTMRNMRSFVTVRGGGYFFMPSRSALAYLASLQRGPGVLPLALTI